MSRLARRAVAQECGIGSLLEHVFSPPRRFPKIPLAVPRAAKSIRLSSFALTPQQKVSETALTCSAPSVQPFYVM